MGTRMRRRAGLVASVVALMLLAAACGSSGPKSPGAGGGGQQGGALLWSLTGGDATTYQTSVKQWNDSHPSSRINLQLFQNDPYKQKLRVSIGAGTGPAVFINWGGGILKSYVDAGDVEDLTPELNKDPAWKKRFIPSVMESVTFDGKVYGIPANTVQPVVLFYNKKVFSEAGAQPPKTWDDLLALVNTFKAKGITPISLGGQSKWPNLMYEEYLVDRIGGPQVFKDIVAGKPNAWSHPAVLKANQMIQQLVDAGAFSKGFSSISYDTGQATALLYTGKAAMHLMGTWEFPSILSSQPNFIKEGSLGWSPFPTVPGGKGDPRDVAGNPANFYSIAAKASANDKKAGIDYLKNGVSSDAYADLLLKGGGVPAMTGLESKLSSAPNAEYLTFVYNLAKNAPSYQLSWDQAVSPAVADALLTNLDRLFLKQITPQQFSDNMNKAGR